LKLPRILNFDIKGLLKNPLFQALAVVTAIALFEALLFFILPRILQEAFQNNLLWTFLPASIISLANAGVAFFFVYKCFDSYDPADLKRKIWRFVMFAVALMLLGHIVSILVKFVFNVEISRPPTWYDWLGYIWIMPCLFVALLRQYRLVRTDSKPNSIMKYGLYGSMVVFSLILLLVSPMFSPSFISLPERFFALWHICWSFAIVIIAISMLSEIYSGILSMSWKLIIAAVFVICVYYAFFIYTGSNNILRGNDLLSVFTQTLIQSATILIAVAGYFESKIITR
jgi:hypothetical protein